MDNKRKKRAASIHLDPDVWDRVTELAQRERRPISQLLRNIVADAVDGRQHPGQSSESDMVPSWP
jgi:predicted transcriptional regulator